MRRDGVFYAFETYGRSTALNRVISECEEYKIDPYSIGSCNREGFNEYLNERSSVKVFFKHLAFFELEFPIQTRTKSVR